MSRTVGRHATVLAAAALVLAVAACSGDDPAVGDGTRIASSTTATTSTVVRQGGANDGVTTTTTSPPTVPAPPSTPYVSGIYADPAHWVCRPDLADACDGDLSATAVAADGTLTVEPYEVPTDPPIDCFYAYPTSSEDATTSSDLVVGREAVVARVQVGAFSQVCDVYAPLYRSVTIAGLFGAGLARNGFVDAWDGAYQDVADAWHHYLANDNGGRPVVLIGHSQGTGHLIRLIRDEIDPDPELRERMLSAILLGGGVAVPGGQLVGGAFQHVPLCTIAEETGCVITYASYPDTLPPGPDAFFGTPNALFSPGSSGVAGCTSPAALLDEGDTLRDRFPTADWAFADRSRSAEISTPFMSLPGLIGARCVERDGRGWLEVTVHADPGDPRTDVVEGRLSPEWGLHAIDVELAQGSLIEIVRRQVEALTEGS